LHPQLVGNLVQLMCRLETEHGLDPKLVLSTTWRLQQQSRDELLSSFAKIQVGTNKTLEKYLNNFGDDGDNNNRTSSWATPDLEHGTAPEGRAAEIQAWLSNHCCQTTNGCFKRSDLLFLILDDLDLLYTETGKRNEAISCQQHNFVCTASYTGYRQVEGAVGLTQERIELALQKVQQQSEIIRRRRNGTGKWTEAEWAFLSANRILMPHLQALRSDQCPSWIMEIAQSHINEQKHEENITALNNRCWCWRRRRE